jgi:hypothetical protein
MMARKSSVNRRVQHDMAAPDPGGPSGDKALDDGAGRTVSGIPGYSESLRREAECGVWRDTIQPEEQPFDVIVHDVDELGRPIAPHPIPTGGEAAEIEYVWAKERTSFKHYLEAILLGGIVAASYLNAIQHLWQ